MKFSVCRMVLVGALSVSAALAQTSPGPGELEAKEDAENRAKLGNLDKVPGFGGVAFGSEFPAGGFELEQDRGALKIYKKPGEKMLMGPALLDEVLYYVFEGKFYGLALHTSDGQDSLALKSILIDAFGTGQDSADGGPSTIWIGKDRGALFDLNTSTGEAGAFLFDHKLHDACLAEQSRAAQAAAKQLIQGK